MKKINISNFDKISYFMSDLVKVDSLENGAIKNGGATKFKNGYYSNVEKNDFITINDKNNKISLFVPSTLHDKEINNKKFVEKYYNEIKKEYKDKTITLFDTKGSWYSEELDKVIIEKVTILSIDKKEVTKKDINTFIRLAENIKEKMYQENVSVSVNSALCII